MTEEQKYLLDKLLSRIDSLLTAVNSKAAFVIAFDTFILGTILLKYKDIMDGFMSPNIKVIVPFIFLFSILGTGLSLYRVFRAVSPFLKSGNQAPTYHSLLFFGSVSQMSIDDFDRQIRRLSDDTLLEDLIRQTHLLSSALTLKFDQITKSMFFTFYFILAPMGFVLALKILDWLIR